MVIVPHYDALVLTLCINGAHRVLVDLSNAVDLLQLPTFIQMKLSSDMLNLVERILSGFNGVTTSMLGDITLLVKADYSKGFVLSRRELGVVQCHSGPDLAALHDGCSFNVPPNGKLYDKRWAS